MEIKTGQEVTFPHDATRSYPNQLGMRDMQARAYEKKGEQYLLIKAPPACGKSRALMFLALDKVEQQKVVDKVIVAVPQQAIGSSFKDTELIANGFPYDWHISPGYDLCTPGEAGKCEAILRFMQDPQAHYLVCTHATLVNFFKQIPQNGLNMACFDRTLVAIDEFHHVSSNTARRAELDGGNNLGQVVHRLMIESTAHLIAMTGSYFRGDSDAILLAADEKRFAKVTYSYYEQMLSNRYLKRLRMDYAFYEGSYISALQEVLDLKRKTIVYIPSVNSRESTKDKQQEVSQIFDAIGENLGRNPETGIYQVKVKIKNTVTPTSDTSASGTPFSVEATSGSPASGATTSGSFASSDFASGNPAGDTFQERIIKVADLITDDGSRDTTINYLRHLKSRDDLDIILALGMAKEGFDWQWCEHVLTIGYRNSLTEVVQIIGRATRDCEDKEEAYFTNLIARPDNTKDEMGSGVNCLLKAITLSLLMQQVLSPNVQFRIRQGQNELFSGENERDENGNRIITINDPEHKLSDSARKFLNAEDMNSLLTELLNDDQKINPALVNDGETGRQQLEGALMQALAETIPELTDYDVLMIVQAAIENIKVKQQELARTQKEEQEEAERKRKEKEKEERKRQEEGKQDSDAEDKDKRKVDPQGSNSADPHKAKLFSDKFHNRFINVNNVKINMIESENPFQGAYDFIARTVNPDLLRRIQEKVNSERNQMTELEATKLWPKIQEFTRQNQRKPSLTSSDAYEVLLAQALAYIRKAKAMRLGAAVAQSQAKSQE